MARSVVTIGMVLLAGLAAASDLPDVPVSSRPEPIDHSDGIDLEIAAGAEPTDWRRRGELLGDLGGLRSILARHGMRLEISSLDEGFARADDGFDAGDHGRYHGLTDVVFTIDTEAAGWWRGGLFVVDLQNSRGRDISEVVGDVQGISNIVAPAGTRFAEYYLDQAVAEGRLRFKIGKQDANADFVVSEGGGEFVNSSFGLIPTVPLPTFPAPAFGAMGSWFPSDTLVVKAGYWDGAPTSGSGMSTAIFDGSRGTIGAVSVEISPFGLDRLAGTYRVGVWRHSDVELPCPPTKVGDEPLTSPAEGLYFTADQGLWETPHRRLALFAQGGWGETDRSAVSRYVGGGLTLAGPFRGRPDDLLGLGVAHADLGRAERTGPDCPGETVVELFYKAPVLGWMTLIPDLQWVQRPAGGEGTVFVAGLRVATSF
jgi:porin